MFRCVIDDVNICLDLIQDEYFLYSEKQSHWFELILRKSDRECLCEAAQQFADGLVSKGVLIEGSFVSVITPAPPKTTESVYDNFSEATAFYDLRILPELILSLAACRSLLRKHHLKKVVDQSIRWRRKVSYASDNDLDNVIRASREFHSWTPFFFTRHDACMFRSLSLIRYLSLRGIKADWVFGVRLCPFTAHCWVEFENVVLDEYLDTTAEYKRIAVI